MQCYIELCTNCDKFVLTDLQRVVHVCVEYPKHVDVKNVGGFDRGMMHTVGMAEASLRAQRQ